MTRRRRRGWTVLCTNPAGHDFTETLYANPLGYVVERKTCRHCLLTVSTEVRSLRDPKPTA